LSIAGPAPGASMSPHEPPSAFDLLSARERTQRSARERRAAVGLRVAGRAFHVQLVVLLGALLVFASSPAEHPVVGLSLVLLLLAAAATWLGWVLVLIAKGDALPRRLIRALAAPVLVIVVAVAIGVDLPVHVRWVHSRPAFDAELRRLDREGSPLQTVDSRPGRLGWYSVDWVDVRAEGTFFYLHAAPISDDAGFVRLPEGVTDQLRTGSYKAYSFLALGDGWYAFIDHWA
jgi:hypothetical protein